MVEFFFVEPKHGTSCKGLWTVRTQHSWHAQVTTIYNQLHQSINPYHLCMVYYVLYFASNLFCFRDSSDDSGTGGWSPIRFVSHPEAPEIDLKSEFERASQILKKTIARGSHDLWGLDDACVDVSRPVDGSFGSSCVSPPVPLCQLLIAARLSN